MAHATTKKTTSMDMTVGAILPHIILFSLPLLFGNVFQLLYNTVDTIIVGRYVGTEALAAVGSTTQMVNIMVFFFNGLSIGAGVVISQNFGAKDYHQLHVSIETTMTMTFLLSIIFTVLGVFLVHPMLIFMATPEDVIPQSTIYLRIYFIGISGLLIYNMGSGILRAVGDSKRPLYFLILTSILNIILDLVFVLVFHAGIAGVGYATILSQFVSAILVLLLLSRTDDIYKMTYHDLRIEGKTLRRIVGIGLPTAIQSTITAFSNVFVQSYVNVFGSICMAGWACYNKLDAFIFLPMSSISGAITTFVSQNIGAGQEKRANKGTFFAISLAIAITTTLATLMFIFAVPASRLMTTDPEVITFSKLFIRANCFFLIANCVNHVLAGGLRGRGDSKAPMFVMLLCFVAIRQTYLFLMTHFVTNTPVVVGFGYPVGWTTCCIVEVSYFVIRYVFLPKRKTSNV